MLKKTFVIFALLITCWSEKSYSQITLTQQFSGLTNPVHITHAGDGSGRLFVVEQAGKIKLIKGGVLQATPFLDITSSVLSDGERGLLSVAFPPDYAGKGYFYVDYTRQTDGATTISRFHISVNPDVADPNSEEVILTIAQPYANHNGGQLAFSPIDGFLYIGMGDGGSGGDPLNNAQNPNSLLGKILRIDVGSPVTPPATYNIPTNNPYYNTSGYRKEIWALGLRNPWRFSFDRLTGDLYIGDVGQDAWEEVDLQAASSAGGENYGWRIMEGAHCYNPNPCGQTGLVLPVVEYNHGTNDSIGCSVTGGFVYRGSAYLGMQGTYFYGDFCTGRIWGLRFDGLTWQTSQLFDATFYISSFGEDEAGNIYVVDYFNGKIYMIAVVVSEVTTYNGFTSGFTTAYVPMLFKNMWGYNAALYVQNVDASNTANVTIDFYDTNGNLSCTKTDTITPLASHGYWLPNETCLPSYWYGGAMITSDQNVVAVARPHIGSEVTIYGGFSP